ncbi:MAG: hypothetical protein RLZZ299_985, partial [Pseudomonadota bacterium]
TRHRLVAEDTPLTLRAWVEGHRTVRAGGEIDLHTEARLDDGVVWSAVTTLLSRAIPGDRSLPRAPAPEVPDGDPARIVAVDVPADLGRRYAAVSGDPNPIHTHALAARIFGFRAPIAHGMWTLARALAELEMPAACRLTARFEAPAFLPGVLRLAVHPRADGGEVVVTDPDGRRHARVRVQVPARPGGVAGTRPRLSPPGASSGARGEDAAAAGGAEPGSASAGPRPRRPTHGGGREGGGQSPPPHDPTGSTG